MRAHHRAGALLIHNGVPGRPAARARNGMVTSPHALASSVGIGLLARGGNAADAIVGMAAALAVLYPHMTGLGGDAFFIYYDAAGEELVGFNGSGACAALGTIQWYRDRGQHLIPERGATAALTVPGAVDAWFALADRFGSMDMETVLSPAIRYAREGAPAARSFVDAIARLAEILVRDEAARELFIRKGPKRVGEVFTNPALAATLESIAHSGRDWFYRGEGAHALNAWAQAAGSPLRLQDLAQHSGFFCEPVAGPFFGFESVTMPPNSQGLALLLAQQIYEAFPRRTPFVDGTPACVHAAVESIRSAIALRDRHVGDPEASQTWRLVLTAARAAALAQRLDPYRAQPVGCCEPENADTAYFACVDARGNAVSFIQSLYQGFGACVVVPELGIALHNRGTAFRLIENSMRSLSPGRRPFHTLMPCMLLREGKPYLVYGSMGGDAQPQIALQLSSRIAAEGLDPQAAIERPRWRFGRDPEDAHPKLRLERRFGEACVAGLVARGHEVELLGDWDETCGHAGAIVIDRANGVLSGAADPRGDGAAVGL